MKKSLALYCNPENILRSLALFILLLLRLNPK